MEMLENISLKPYNTFGIDVRARYFARIRSAEELQLRSSIFKPLRRSPDTFGQASNLLVLGGGSNILFTGDYDGLVLKNEINGIRKIKEDDEYVYVCAGAGENWHRFVLTCIANNWAGVENLSLIPGNVGASPMQNIGAYGVELKDVFHELEAFHMEEKANYCFSKSDCEFGYRESVFKKKHKDRFIILNVTYKLRKVPQFNISYGAISEELEKMRVKQISIRAISDAVVSIRSSKLPDPAQVGNAGSFFKNPTVTVPVFEKMALEFPGIVSYKNLDGSIKLAAGWMIERCGPNNSVSWKGFRRGDAGCHSKQALVLVNHGHASGEEINALADEIAASVFSKFGVLMEKEVNIF